MTGWCSIVCIYYVYPFIHLLMNIWNVSTCWLLQIMLLWTWCTIFCLSPVFNSSGYVPRNGNAESYGNSIFNFLRKHQNTIVSHSGWTILHSYQQCMIYSLNFYIYFSIHFIYHMVHYIPGFPRCVLVIKNLPANAGDIRDEGSIPGLGRFPGGGPVNPQQYSCLENPMDREARWATVHGITKESDMT